MRLTALCLLTSAAFGQTFEVASIKVRRLPLHTVAGYSSSGPRVVYEGWPIRMLIVEAYGIKPYKVAFAGQAPSGDDYYDVIAKADGEGARTRAEFRPMLRALLAERFHLQLHREMRDIPVYHLVVAKGGPKLKAGDPESTAPTHIGVNGRNQFVESKKMTMDDLAGAMRSGLGVDRPVVDRTGLTGVYDIRLEAALPSRATAESDAVYISIFTAVQQQLGLKLEPAKTPVEVVVIDAVGNPTEN